MGYCRYVDVFQGCAKIELPEGDGLSSSWHFIKGLTGNTSPAAVLPFGKISCGCYSGGYPTGYGNQKINSGQPVEPLADRPVTFGFAHLCQQGVGAIGSYYNYAVTTPFCGELESTDLGKTIVGEYAEPGYYRMDTDDGILSEATVSEHCALHRYTFGSRNGRISVDFANNGLYHGDARVRGNAEDGHLHLVSGNEIRADVVLEGVRIYFSVLCPEAESASLYEGTEMRDGNALHFGHAGGKIGCVFESSSPVMHLKVSLSVRSAAFAQHERQEETRDFDQVRSLAGQAWERALSRIEIDADERTKRIFYSNLYHTLTKPSDMSKESYLYEDDDFVVDFATLWDVYKTQMPLLFTLYPEISRKIINTYVCLCEKLGQFPNTFILRDDYLVESNQARMLAEYLIADAYYRNVGPVDWDRALDAIERDIDRDDFRKFCRTGYSPVRTHMLDMAEGATNVARLAKALGRDDLAEKLERCGRYWQNAFDGRTGLLPDSCTYYEGNHWNYSFRILNDMGARIALCGTEERFLALLDRFFGFACADDRSARFEGYNNEPDMEAPYCYAFTKRHDRLCDIINDAGRYQFAEGRGGIPGNNDSGGLSSCYIWNTTGIFPVSGQDLMIVGCPQVGKATFHLSSGKKFTVEKSGSGDHVAAAYLDGEKLDRWFFSAKRMMHGGTLRIEMR